MSSADFVGTWRLVSFESRLANGDVRYPMGAQPIGRIIYDAKGNMAVAFSRADRPRMGGPDKVRAPLEEKGAALDSFEAYFGTYRVYETRGIVTHHVEGALFPDWVGTDQERFYAFEGDRLELSTAPTDYGGITATAVLVWQRM